MSSAPVAIEGTRIAHLIESDGPGGAERMVASLAGELAARGCPGVAFLPRNGEGWLGRELQEAGVQVEHFTLDRPLSPKCARDLEAAFRDHRIDVAHSHEFTMAVYGSWAAHRAAVPHVITMHGGRYYAKAWRRRIALRLAVASSGGVHAVSRDLGSSLQRDLYLSPSQVHVVPNGVRVRPAGTHSLRAELQLESDERLLLAVGNLYPVKGHRFLIDALSSLSGRHPTLHLAIAGRGELANALMEQARSLGIVARVHLLGLRSDIPALLADADLFVMPSLSEGLPVAVLEAMFAGRAIVATDVGEVRSVLQGDAGLVVPPADSAALAAAIDRLVEDPAEARRLGERAAARAAEAYSLDRMVERYAGIYSGLLSTARGS